MIKTVSILFVCMGNICRSPTAHGIFRQLVQAENLEAYFEIESAGTHSDIWHKGSVSDPRSVATALKYDCDISDLRSRQLVACDFDYYDYIVAMDEQNVMDMAVIAKKTHDMGKVTKLLDYAPHLNLKDVPDPYYHHGFDQVYLMIDTACRKLLSHLKTNLQIDKNNELS
ncbi:low molecular weight protein-tyrosine-phosphatase [Fastidiosibacter lacustris]|uniref:low molecular weight protein-tyrosine-phosphatase n=1 Tax=Fastidiosibacter lacustris TaxID=2056695 RepID=UPI000E354331|nr:low molecular weight protein-tyrosine-phosphatase [Fastidiosibacter lacustris]